MKTTINHYLLLAFFALFAFLACQDETAEIDISDEQESIQPNSQLVTLLNRATANFGAIDDILDGASCFSIELPVTIIVDDVTIIIEDETDLEQLEDLLGDFNNDDDFLDFLFPITIIYSDYSEIVIESEEQLENLINECVGDEDDIIECIDFVYPISFSVFDSGFDLLETIVIEDDEALYNFLDDLEDNENALIVSLNYPVTLVYSNGEMIEVNSNEELVNVLESVDGECEDDLECSITDINEILQECPWNFTDGTDNFENYQMVFNENGDLLIPEGAAGSAIGGSWSLSLTDNGPILIFSDLTAFQDSLGGEWLIVECHEDGELTMIRDNMVIELEKDCDTEPNCNQQEIINYILSCNIVPTIDGYTPSLTTFQFSEDNSLFTMFEGDLPHNGTWDVSSDEEGIFLVINFNGLDNYNGQWYLSECNDSSLAFYQDDRELILTCEDNPFECFGNYDLIVCDQDDDLEDGFGIFDLNQIFDNCPNDDVVYYFYSTLNDAEIEANPLPNPYVNIISNTQTIYSRVALASNANVFEIFSHNLIVEDCCESSDVLLDDLVIYMPFANQAKDLISDEYATDWNAESITNNFVEDRDGNAACAISFSGTDSITIPVTAQNQLVQGDSFSISLWFKMENTNEGDLEIFFRKLGNATQGFNVGVHDLNTPLVFDNLSTSLWDNDWNTEVDVQWENTDWHHFVITLDSNNTLRLYRDGVERGAIENSNFSIGSDPTSFFALGESFQGVLDDLRVYKRVLNPDEVSVLQNLEADCFSCL